MLGSRLKEARKTKGLSLSKLSDITGISKSNLSFFENNKSQPSSGALILLKEHLDVNLNWLLTGSGTMFCEDKCHGKPDQDRIEELEAQVILLRGQCAALAEEINNLDNKNQELNDELRDRLRQMLGLQDSLLKLKS